MTDLFDIANEAQINKAIPLAERMRPVTIKDFVGQNHIAESGSLLRRAIQLDNLGSCIFWGPPGTGKSTLANIIANSTSGKFIKLNAVTSGVADIKVAVADAKNTLKFEGRRTYLLLDECHRFSKTQQDSLLPHVEKGDIIFIGSTTENPYSSLTPAIVSRCRVFEFKSLTDEIIEKALYKAINDKNKGFGNLKINIETDAIKHITTTSNGDLRSAYNALELAVLTAEQGEMVEITLKDAVQSTQKKALSYDTNSYYDMLSCFCKSLRGSDSNASLYYAFRLIEGGCDPLLLARRLVVHSSEDVGLADPNALVVATNALVAYQNLGQPEGLIPLAQAIIYVAEAEKSNSVVEAMDRVREAIKLVKDGEIPPHLKNSVFASKESKKQSSHYKYPHDYGGYVEQDYLPKSLLDKKFYIPKNSGYELKIKQIRKNKGMID